jgi:amino-acid N-acetyltransferase
MLSRAANSIRSGYGKHHEEERVQTPMTPPAATITIRPARATDVEKIQQLITAHSSQGLMLPRSRYKIFSRLQGFVVAEDDEGRVIACGALVILWGDLAEIQSLAVAAHRIGQGYGRRIVAELIERARGLEIPNVLTLTYQVEFFAKLGFVVTDKDAVPRKTWGECLECPKLECCDETAMLYQIA